MEKSVNILVWSFDVVAAHVLGFGANAEIGEGRPVGLFAKSNLVKAAVGH